jgi:hypothetical protein
VTATGYRAYTHEDISEPAPGFPAPRSDLARHKDTYLPLFCNEVRFRASFGPPSTNVRPCCDFPLRAIGAISLPSLAWLVLGALRPLGPVVWSTLCLPI